MTYQIIIGGIESHDLASTGGWRDVKSWCDELSVEKYEELIRFIEQGLSQDIGELSSQLDRAIADDIPGDSTVLSTLHNLQSLLSGRSPTAESIFVSGGLSDVEIDNGDEWEGMGDS